MKDRQILLPGLLAVLLISIVLPGCAYVIEKETSTMEEAFTDVVLLSTTDMHGKCWETNVLSGNEEKNNMLRVSRAAADLREEYGAENVILVDNGDTFQGTRYLRSSLRIVLRETPTIPWLWHCV